VEERLAALCGEAEMLARALPLTERAREILGGAASALRWERA
jgi:geranylgeranyl diphosphate synthase type I